MGKTRGHGSRRGGYRGRGRGRGGGGGGDSDEDEVEPQRGLGGQNSTVGMLPPSDSDDEGSEKEKPAAAKPAKPQGQSSKVGQLPPSDSDEDEDSEEEESEDSEEPPMPEYLTQTAPKKKKEEEDEPDPEQIKKDMERLQLIKDRRKLQQRCGQRYGVALHGHLGERPVEAHC